MFDFYVKNLHKIKILLKNIFYLLLKDNFFFQETNELQNELERVERKMEKNFQLSIPDSRVH